MGARFLSSTGLGSGNLIGRAEFPPAPALDKNRSPSFDPTQTGLCKFGCGFGARGRRSFVGMVRGWRSPSVFQELSAPK